VHVGLLQEVGSAYIGEADEGDGKAGEDLTANAEVAILLMGNGALVSSETSRTGRQIIHSRRRGLSSPSRGGWLGPSKWWRLRG